MFHVYLMLNCHATPGNECVCSFHYIFIMVLIIGYLSNLRVVHVLSSGIQKISGIILNV